MTARPADQPSVLSVASSIAEGVPVDWEHLPADADGTTTAVFDELRVLERVSRMSQPVPNTWGSFAILGEIGHGAYGTVYRALDATLNLEVALKVIRPRAPLRPRDPDRALNEARLLAQLNHQNVVRVFKAERQGQDVGVAMELLHGRTFDELVVQQGPFNAREAMLVGVDICCGLAAVHGARLVHGDVKAQNVMRAAGGRTVLMDFGAGYDVKTDDTAARRFAGTPLYLAPEVFAGSARTPVSDIYSVGVLLFYLATGHFPIEGSSGTEVRRKHESGGTRRLLRDVRADLPDTFIHVVERATAERPGERYQTAGELEAALNKALRHVDPVPNPKPQPVVTRPLLFAVAGGLAVLALWFALGDRSPDRQQPLAAVPGAAVTDSAVPSPAGAEATAADSYRIEAAFYREQGRTPVRLDPGARVAPGDQLSLQVVSSVPTYVYVVNEDDRGDSYLLFPLPGLPANPLAAGTRHEIPGIVNGSRVNWRVSSAGGREHFLIFASPQPLSPAFQRVFDALPRPSADAPVLAQPLSTDLVGVLRGVGGLAKAPGPAAGPGLRAEFGSPLPTGEETARGVWVRQLTLDNPGR